MELIFERLMISIQCKLRLIYMSILPDKVTNTAYIREEAESGPNWVIGQIIVSLFNGLVPFIIATLLPIPQWVAFVVWGVASIATFAILCLARSSAIASDYNLHD